MDPVGMGNSGQIVVQLEIARDGERIAGTLSTSGLVLPFNGWLGLAAAIERATNLTGAQARNPEKMRDDPS